MGGGLYIRYAEILGLQEGRKLPCAVWQCAGTTQTTAATMGKGREVGEGAQPETTHTVFGSLSRNISSALLYGPSSTEDKWLLENLSRVCAASPGGAEDKWKVKCPGPYRLLLRKL